MSKKTTQNTNPARQPDTTTKTSSGASTGNTTENNPDVVAGGDEQKPDGAAPNASATKPKDASDPVGGGPPTEEAPRARAPADDSKNDNDSKNDKTKSDASDGDPSGDNGTPEKGAVQSWKSGGFLPVNGDAVPYNGLEITAQSTLVDGKVACVDVAFIDYTNSPKGVTTSIPALLTNGRWASVPQPKISLTPVKKNKETKPANDKAAGTEKEKATKAGDNPSGSGAPVPTPTPTPVSEPKFTVVGDVSVEAALSGLYLRVRLSYGPPHRVRNELGYIYKLYAEPSAT